MEDNFNLDHSNEVTDLHLNPTQFTHKIKRHGNNQIIWPPPRIVKENLEIQFPYKETFTLKLCTKAKEIVSDAKKKGIDNLKEFLITLPTNLYSGVKSSGNLAYSSIERLYKIYYNWKIPKEDEKIFEKLEDNWVFVLHSSKHNGLLEDLKLKQENPEIHFTQSNILMKNLKKNQKNSSILTDNINPEGKLSELWEFNELMRKKQENTKEDDTFSIMDEVQDYDDLDYAVPMREEDIEQLFSNYMKNHNIPYIDERKYPEENKNQYSEFPIEKYPVLLN